MPAENDPQDVIKIDTDLVPLDIVALDSKGHLVRNLRKEDFKLFEDGIERPIAAFNLEKVEGSPRPVAIVFAIDVSGSMTPEEAARVGDAMREFLGLTNWPDGVRASAAAVSSASTASTSKNRPKTVFIARNAAAMPALEPRNARRLTPS